MELKLKFVLLILCIIFILFVSKKVEKGHLQLKYSLSWYSVTIILIIFTIFDNMLIPIKEFLGFETLSNMIFLFGFLIITMIVFALNVKISTISNKVTTLTQEVAILKKELKDEKNKRNNK